VVITDHVNRKGEPKIVEECTLPVTGLGVVHRIITDLAVLDVTDEGLVLKELAPGVSAADVQEKTGTKVLAGPDLTEMSL